jgi:chromatin segregation and condensation protein Rec8/ScpA/Scc1 (kleisin family)
MNTQELRDKINEIKKRDLGDLSLKVIENWEDQIKNYDSIKSLYELPQFKDLISEFEGIMNNVNEILAEQEVNNDEDIRKRQQLISDKRVFGTFLKRFAIPDIKEIENEVNNNYKNFYEKPTEIKE